MRENFQRRNAGHARGDLNDEFVFKRSSFVIPRASFKISSALKFFFLFLVFSQINFAQDDQQPKDVAAPPLKIISKEEKSQLDAQTEIKKRTILVLELMDARLVRAEAFAVKEQHREMFVELGAFDALMENALAFLDESKEKKSKVLDNLKRVEITLRKYITRLEIIRRDLPIRYEYYVRRLVKRARDARARAVEPMFGETVLPEKKDNEN